MLMNTIREGSNSIGASAEARQALTATLSGVYSFWVTCKKGCDEEECYIYSKGTTTRRRRFS